MKKESARAAFLAAAPLGYLVMAVALVAVVAVNGAYPSGADAMLHLYRGDMVLRSLEQGSLPPYYDAMWSNGAELFRFVPPLSAWVLALCQTLAGGKIFFGYLLFLGGEFYLGALLWWELGRREGRAALGTVLGALWFFLPYHMRVLFVEGDLPRSLAITFLPHLFYEAGAFLRTRARRHGLLVALEGCLLALTHPGFFGMTALALLLWALLGGRLLRRERGALALGLCLLSGALLAGVWLAPYFGSGILKLEWWDEMQGSFQSLLRTLDAAAIWNGGGRALTCGVGLAAALCFVALLGPGSVRGEALTALALLGATTTAFGAAVQFLPLSQHLRMVWVFPCVAVLSFFALLGWRELRRGVCVLLCLLLVLDALACRSLVTGGDLEKLPVEERMDKAMSAALLTQAQELTRQRLAILDEGELGGEGIFLATAYGQPIPITGGDRRAHAATHVRQERVSRALASRNYRYVFDRCLELGCDSVLLRRAEVPQQDWLSGAPNRAAAALGYELVETTGGYALYHMETIPSWGLVSRYSAIGLGETAYRMSLSFPAMKETADPCLDHYTLDELSGYALVYLSGFTYEDRTAAEELVRALAQAGVRVVIDAEGLPEDRASRDRSFLGVRCNSMELSNGYPELEVGGRLLETGLFPRDYTKWQTVYVEGLSEVRGVAWANGLELPFYGTAESENILFLGLGLERYLFLTHDQAARELFAQVLDLSEADLPYRRLVPVEVEYTADGLAVTTNTDEVNTTLSCLDAFVSGEELKNDDQLLVVNAGTTRIALRYPCLGWGVGATGAGALLLLLTLLCRKRRPEEKAERPTEGGELT